MAKVKAFTIFDSLIAVAIVSILLMAISFAFGILIDSEKPLIYFKAKEEVSLLHNELIESKSYLNQTIDNETYSIQQKIETYHGRTDIFQVTYTILQSSKIIYTEKRLILNEED